MALVAGLGVVAGCGAPLSAMEYRARATGICLRAQREDKALNAGSPGPDRERVSRRAAETAARTTTDLRALDPPPELERADAELKQVLDGLSKLSQKVRQEGQGAAVDELHRLNERGDAAFRALGVPACQRA